MEYLTFWLVDGDDDEFPHANNTAAASQTWPWTPARGLSETKARRGPPLLVGGELPANYSCVVPPLFGGEQ